MKLQQRSLPSPAAVALRVVTISATLCVLAVPAQASDLASGLTSAPKAASPQRALLLSVGQANQSTEPLGQSLKGLGYTEVSVSGDEQVDSWSLGYRQPLSRRFSVDLQYLQQGDAKSSVKATLPSLKTNAQAAKDTAKAMPKRGEGVSVLALYHHPVGRKLTLQAGLGALAWKSKRTATVGTDTFISKSDGISATVKLGVSYPITRNTRLEGHWQHIDMPDEAVDRIGVGIAVGF